MKWITRGKVKVDRVACPWLIRRFIDPKAELVFVSAGEVMTKTAELGATPFDVKGRELGHHGEDVSFTSFLKKYELTEPALVLPGEIMRAAAAVVTGREFEVVARVKRLLPKALSSAEGDGARGGALLLRAHGRAAAIRRRTVRPRRSGRGPIQVAPQQVGKPGRMGSSCSAM